MMKLKENYLAPLHEYTDLPFRMLAQKHKAKATMAPIISTTAITRSKTVLKHLDLHKDEKFLGAQLIGKKPEEFLEAARLIAERFPCVKWLDVNAGCPSRNAFGSGGGAALLDKPKLIKDIVSALLKTGFPISVKMRLAPTMGETLEFAKAAGEADFITVHGRVAKQYYSGAADWNAIKSVKEASKIPVVGNGDITSIAQGKNLVKEGYCDSFMIGRGALSNPLIFEGKEAKTKGQKKEVFLEFISLARKYAEEGKEPRLFNCRLKAFELYKSLPNIAKFRGDIAKTKTLDELVQEIEAF